MKKQIVCCKKANLAKAFVSLDETPGLKRLLVFALRKLDAKPSVTVDLHVKELVESGLYLNERSAELGIKRNLSDVLRIRVAYGENLFSRVSQSQDGCTLTLNPRVNITDAVRGFRAFPLALLSPSAARPRAKCRDLAYALFLEAQNNVDALAENGKFIVPFSTLQARLNLPIVKPTSNFLGLQKIQVPLETAIDKLVDISSGTGLTIEPTYCEDGIAEYLKKSFLTVTFSGDLLHDFLAAFDMEPTAAPEETTSKETSSKEEPAPIKEAPFAFLADDSIRIPGVTEKAYPLVEVLQQRKSALEQGVEFFKLEKLWMTKFIEGNPTHDERDERVRSSMDRYIKGLQIRLSVYDMLAQRKSANDPKETADYLFGLSKFLSHPERLRTKDGQSPSKAVAHQMMTVSGEAHVAASIVKASMRGKNDD